MKNLKIINSILISTVLLLLLIAILIGIKLLFSNVKGFEWGSFTDWLSSLSSIITLAFAFYVYSRWKKDRYREDAYAIQKKIITQHFPKIFMIADELDARLTNFQYRINGHNHHLKDSVLDSMQTYLIDTITELEITSQQLQNDINVIKLFRHKPTSEFKNICIATTRVIEIIIQCIKNLIGYLRGLKMSEFEHLRRKMYDGFNGMIPLTANKINILSDAKNYIFSSNRDLNTLFTNF
ncbi:hypothetical protein I5412_08690 [Citrobacter koseri]|uniref:hypothetical protein n=1 Tax=Citrobacter koseri TaxID=545 RepID=UPI001907312B|nr:hypothetical protein [Citrobacter koseri]MBJ8875059.1 hypothetical protein [Citrobacter koseri]